jgi:mannose-6-phosphate isomerase-like protein (cupin superfamily)
MHDHRQTRSFALTENCVHLAGDGRMRPVASRRRILPGLSDGSVLALSRVISPADVHYPVWEMHPGGDELLLLTSGVLSVEVREDGAERIVPLRPEAAFIVAAGVWHRLIVHQPSQLMAITPRHNTVHRRD